MDGNAFQIGALKSTIRELESSIAREKEFNAANRRINADYLVNILRKFLMSVHPAERASLVPVLCTLLHLQVDETKVIVEKWAVKHTGGLVGWLLPPRPPPVTSSFEDDSQVQDELNSAGGMKMSRDGSNQKQMNAGDLSYDPKTGSSGGLDIYA